MKKSRIVFVTSVFDEIREGPAVYARYIWEHMKDEPQFDFHLVTTVSKRKHDNIHESGLGSSSLRTYQQLQQKALQVAHSLGGTVLVHGNAAHTLWMFDQYRGPIVAQVNDYAAVDAVHDTFGYWGELQLKRHLVLLWRRRNEARMVARANMVLSNSEFTMAKLLRSYRLRTERVSVLYKAVDTVEFTRPSQLSVDLFPGRTPGLRLVFVGTNWRIKGLDILIRALSRVAVVLPGVSLVVAGPDPEAAENRQLIQLIERYDVQARVHFAGPVARSELAQILWHSDLKVLPSRKEALGVSLLEAMAAGLPVIGSDVGGIPEIVTSDAYGRLFEAGNDMALADAIIALLGDPVNLRQIGIAAAVRAQDFGVATMLAKLKVIYSDVLASYEATQKRQCATAVCAKV